MPGYKSKVVSTAATSMAAPQNQRLNRGRRRWSVECFIALAKMSAAKGLTDYASLLNIRVRFYIASFTSRGRGDSRKDRHAGGHATYVLEHKFSLECGAGPHARAVPVVQYPCQGGG